MKYPEELRERYKKCLLDEHNIIANFLKTQSERKHDTWQFVKPIEVISNNGSLVQIKGIKLDKYSVVLFCVDVFMEEDWWECSYFAYGEISKVIEALPDADEIVKINAISDISAYLDNGNIAWLTGTKHIIGDGFDVIKVSKSDDNVNVILRKFKVNSDSISLNKLSSKEVLQLRNHISIDALHKSKEYKKLMDLLKCEENMRFECANYGDIAFVINDFMFNVSSVSRDSQGNLVIYGYGNKEIGRCDKLTEKDIKSEYLVSIIEEIERSNIIDTHNGHDKWLVRCINNAWKSKKYHNKFQSILYAMIIRDHDEYECKYGDIPKDADFDWAMEHAHEIMEGVCNDSDLQMILSYIRYEK